MNQNQKVISRLPVEEVWADQSLVSTVKIRDLDASDVVDLLRSAVVRFVVADVGKPYEWIPCKEKFEFWKNEVKVHLVAPESKAVLEDCPGEYCYFASEWKSYDGDTIILLSKAH